MAALPVRAGRGKMRVESEAVPDIGCEVAAENKFSRASRILKIAAFTLFLALAPVSRSAEQFASITTRDGERYTNAEITELTPKGVMLRSDSGVALIAYAQLPQQLQTRYGYDPRALAQVLAGGIEGTYSYDDSVRAFAGAIIELKGNAFTL